MLLLFKSLLKLLKCFVHPSSLLNLFSFTVFSNPLADFTCLWHFSQVETFRKPLNKQVLDDDDIVRLNSYLGLSRNVPRSSDSDAVEEVCVSAE